MIAANDSQRQCLRCSEPFDGPATKKFCSYRCKSLSGSAKTCEQCGCTFYRRARPDDAARFCSRECGVEHKRQGVVGKKPKPYVPNPVLPRPCVQCGVHFTPGSNNTVICSDACRLERARLASLQHANDNHTPKVLQCPECGETFTTVYGDKRRSYCSKVCSTRANRRVRHKADRARLRGVTVEMVDPLKVFERDGWTCQLCKAKTPRKLRGTYEPRAPELDHIMPLSLGGEHSYANTQCACRECNAKKGATPMGQMRLFG